MLLLALLVVGLEGYRRVSSISIGRFWFLGLDL